MRGLIHGLLAAGVLLGIPGTVLAAEGAPAVDTGDTAWVLISAALVMLMTPGLAFFYGGMVRSKNVLTTIMQSFFIVAMVSVQWVLFGFSLAFGPDINGVIGSLSWAGLTDMSLFAAPYEDYSATVPLFAFAAFQCMFAVITAALITGAYAERFKFGAFVLFTFLWTTFLYDPMAHWVWLNLARLCCLPFCGLRFCTTPWRTGYGELAAGCVIWARSTLRAARLSIF